MNKYWFEVTDTFGGEANYCWVRHYIVNAENMTQAVRKVNKQEGYKKLDKVLDCGEDDTHWVPRGCCIKIMGSYMDDQAYDCMKGNAKELQ